MPRFSWALASRCALLDYLGTGDTLDDFLEDFPGVLREQAVQFLEQAVDALLNHAPSDEARPADLGPAA